MRTPRLPLLNKLPSIPNVPNAEVHLFAAAVAVGLVAAAFGVGFTELLQWLQAQLLGDGDPIARIAEQPWYVKLLLPAFGGLLLGPIVYIWFPEARSHGVPEVMAAVALQQGRIPKRVIFVKGLASALTISTGGSVGQEGPVVVIGGTLGSALGGLFKLPSRSVKTLVGCGVAAGIASVFNAPIAGAFFALEVILGNFAAPTFAPIVVASVTATAVSRAFLGNTPAFSVPAYSLQSPMEIPLYALLGLLIGIVSVGLIRALQFWQRRFESSPIKPWLRPAVGGLAIGALLQVAPQLYGTGFSAITDLVHHRYDLLLVFSLLALKLVATPITLGSGGSGGLFSPSLFMGAAVGGLFGTTMHALYPSWVATPGAYAMVGMGAMVAGSTHAPITAILMLFEITSDYQIIVPLMTACVLSTVVASWLEPESIYTEKLAARGVSLRMGREEMILRSHRVEDVMRPEARTIKAGAPFREVVADLLASRLTDRYVIDEHGAYVGMFSLQDIKQVLNDEDLAPLIIAADLVRSRSLSVPPDLTLSDCTDRFLTSDEERLPVVDPQTQKVLGTVSEHDIISLYNREILKKDFLGTLAFERGGDGRKVRDYVQLPTEYQVCQLPVPAKLVGQTLKEVGMRARYGLTVVTIRPRGEAQGHNIPNPDLPLHEDDVLVVVGRERDIAALRDEES